jgi:hypothetical protein
LKGGISGGMAVLSYSQFNPSISSITVTPSMNILFVVVTEVLKKPRALVSGLAAFIILPLISVGGGSNKPPPDVVWGLPSLIKLK